MHWALCSSLFAGIKSSQKRLKAQQAEGRWSAACEVLWAGGKWPDRFPGDQPEERNVSAALKSQSRVLGWVPRGRHTLGMPRPQVHPPPVPQGHSLVAQCESGPSSYAESEHCPVTPALPGDGYRGQARLHFPVKITETNPSRPPANWRWGWADTAALWSQLQSTCSTSPGLSAWPGHGPPTSPVSTALPLSTV